MRLDHQLNGRIIITQTNSNQLLMSDLHIWVSYHVEHRDVNLKARDKAIDNNCLEQKGENLEYISKRPHIPSNKRKL
jgi:hypothetical protein